MNASQGIEQRLGGDWLHIHCGDMSAETLRRGGVPGTVHVMHDPACCGPLSYRGGYQARADFLVACGAPFDPQTFARNLEREDAVLAAAAHYDEVVLWFDHCLFDQGILVRTMDRLAATGARISLICIDTFPGFAHFKGLGELNPTQMASLFPTRHLVTSAELALASKAWAALCAPDPLAIQALCRADTSALPFLAGALVRHLQEFPAVGNGLSRTENAALRAIEAGHATLPSVFVAVSDAEERPFLGDTMLWWILKPLADARHPAIRVDGPGPLPGWNADRPLDAWALALTDVGRALIDQTADWLALNGLDRWLGGVHLTDAATAWRWNATARRIERAIA